MLEAISLGMWLLLLLAPWQSWRCREQLEVGNNDRAALFPENLTLLIPARNEAAVIENTLNALFTAYPDARIVLVDDESTDSTAETVLRISRDYGANLCLIKGKPAPAGWTGKLWALEQGICSVTTLWVLLLDADIALKKEMIAVLCQKTMEGYDLISVLAQPNLDGFWVRWLMQTYVFFFKLLYPFALANNPRAPISAAAGGVILVRKASLHQAGGFSAWHDALIDDCTMAKHFKRMGARTWLGLTHGATSLRKQGFTSIIHMISRTAYMQLSESLLLLLVATGLMLLAFVIPIWGLSQPFPQRWVTIAAIIAMMISYLPTLWFYSLPWINAFSLPLVSVLYLALTWYSAFRSWRGIRSSWKGRCYHRSLEK